MSTDDDVGEHGPTVAEGDERLVRVLERIASTLEWILGGMVLLAVLLVGVIASNLV